MEAEKITSDLFEAWDRYKKEKEVSPNAQYLEYVGGSSTPSTPAMDAGSVPAIPGMGGRNLLLNLLYTRSRKLHYLEVKFRQLVIPDNWLVIFIQTEFHNENIDILTSLLSLTLITQSMMIAKFPALKSKIDSEVSKFEWEGIEKSFPEWAGMTQMEAEKITSDPALPAAPGTPIPGAPVSAPISGIGGRDTPPIPGIAGTLPASIALLV